MSFSCTTDSESTPENIDSNKILRFLKQILRLKISALIWIILSIRETKMKASTNFKFYT